MYIADVLSILQTLSPMVSTIGYEEMKAHVARVVSSLLASDSILQQMMQAQEEDPQMPEPSRLWKLRKMILRFQNPADHGSLRRKFSYSRLQQIMEAQEEDPLYEKIN